MKYPFFVLIISFMLSGTELSAQNEIPLSVLVPASHSVLNSQQLKQLGKKTKRMVTRNGLAATGSQQFAIIADLEVNKEREAELLTSSVTVVEIEVQLEIKQLDSRLVFNTTALTASGEGSSKKEAISSAISNLKTNSNDLKVFFADSQTKMLAYYNDNCQHLIQEAQTHENTKAYRKAMSLLYSIPKGTTCFEEANEQIANIFFLYQNHECQNWLNKAQTLLSGNHYAAALATLAQIDPTSSCEAELKLMIKKTAKKVDAEERRNWDALQERYHNEVALEELRIELMAEVMKEYYQHQAADVQQFIVIR